MAAKTEPTERQSAVATATKRQTTAEVLHGSDDKSNKQLDELKGRLDNLLRRGPQRGPVEDLHGSDGKLDEPLRTTRKSLQPISLPSKPVADLHGSRDNEQLEGSVRPSPRRKPEEEDEPVARPWITSYPNHEASERQANYDRLVAIEKGMKRRGSRGFAGYLVAILIGVTTTLALQSYLGWTKPPAVERKVAPIDQTAPATPSIDPGQVQQMARDVATLRQTVGQLAAGLDQVTRELGKLDAADVEILAKITAAPPPPRPAPASKPTPIARPSSPALVTHPTSLAPPPPPNHANSPEPGTGADRE